MCHTVADGTFIFAETPSFDIVCGTDSYTGLVVAHLPSKSFVGKLRNGNSKEKFILRQARSADSCVGYFCGAHLRVKFCFGSS